MFQHTSQAVPAPRHKGFTLIELLVVIAIIAILAAILFPVFARARENARRTSCLSNVKQLALGVIQYTQDYDELYPPSNYGISYDTPDAWIAEGCTDTSVPCGKFEMASNDSVGLHRRSWTDSIFPYVKSLQLFVCPSASWDAKTVSYAYSGGLSGGVAYEYQVGAGLPRNAPRTSGISMAAVGRPSEVIMLADTNHNGMSTRLYWLFHAGALGNPYFYQITAPHLEGGNFAFADGHAKWSNVRSEMFRGSWTHKSWNPYIQ